MAKILVTDPIHEDALRKLEELGEVIVLEDADEEKIREHVRDADAWVVRSGTRVTRELIKEAERLKVIARAGVGVDNIDVKAATERGIIVVNAPESSSISVAEHTMGLILALARKIPQADRSVRRGEWDRKTFMGVELAGKTLGLIGLGRIGQQVAKRAKAFEMEVIAYDPYIPRKVAEELGVELVDELEELLERADIVSIHVPLTEETEGMIGEEELKRMKNSAFLINCARGKIVDEEALIKALKEGWIAGAALDVFAEEPPGEDHPLYELDNVVLTPHIGGSTGEAQRSAGLIVAREIERVLKGEIPENVVNLPLAGVPDDVRELMEVGERLADAAAQALEGRLRSVQVKVGGEFEDREKEALKRAILKGCLDRVLTDPVTMVNAIDVAERRGIEFEFTVSDELEGGEVEVVVRSDEDEISLRGELIEDRVYLTSVNGYEVRFKLSGPTLFVWHVDRPGVIGEVGIILGEHRVNVAAMEVGRRERGGEAIMVIRTDEEPPEECLRAIDEVEPVRRVELVRC
ncbi:phosphoglycerate dehydrogenase [Methanopyrus sp. KOL6]|uniref:phosphoglycerate dehydrogenase n=1 Tax=Methanopyrus sp. KOL6 TaxID=1937004 RepID=UPI000B4B34C3|nr:phosphoglycerate dehydrogenase [Methanopyrus sp. KOL6]